MQIRWTVFNLIIPAKEGLTFTGNRAIIEDRNGNIWIGSDWGLFKYDGKSFTGYAGEVFTNIFSLLESKMEIYGLVHRMEYSKERRLVETSIQ